jgi:FkbM family methyltransferase
MQPSAALSKFATWTKNLGIACAVRYSLYRIFNRMLGERLLTLKVRGFPRPVYCRAGGSDLRVFAQVLANREYRCLDQSHISGLVIDCGANIGLSTLYFLRRFPKVHVIALEPDPDNFKMLARNTAAFRDRVTLLQAAVWNKNTSLVFSEARALNRQEWAKTCREAEEREVPQIQAFDIPTILGMSSFKRVGLLKVDIESGELALFDHSAKSWLDLVDVITIELHGAACEKAFHSIVRAEDFVVSYCEELTVCLRKTRCSPLH